MDLKRFIEFLINLLLFPFLFSLPSFTLFIQQLGKKLIEMKALKHFKRVVLKVTRLGIFFLIFNNKKYAEISIAQKKNTEKINSIK